MLGRSWSAAEAQARSSSDTDRSDRSCIPCQGGGGVKPVCTRMFAMKWNDDGRNNKRSTMSSPRRQYMIIGSGFVYFILLFMGIWSLHSEQLCSQLPDCFLRHKGAL